MYSNPCLLLFSYLTYSHMDVYVQKWYNIHLTELLKGLNETMFRQWPTFLCIACLIWIKQSKQGSWPYACLLIGTVALRELKHFEIQMNSVQISPVWSLFKWQEEITVDIIHIGAKDTFWAPTQKYHIIIVLLTFVILFNVLHMTVSHANQFLFFLLLKIRNIPYLLCF